MFEVHADNWKLVGIFLALSTQWLIAVGLGGHIYLGINYASIEPTLRHLGVPRSKWREGFAAVRLMEAAALPIKNTPPARAAG